MQLITAITFGTRKTGWLYRIKGTAAETRQLIEDYRTHVECVWKVRDLVPTGDHGDMCVDVQLFPAYQGEASNPSWKLVHDALVDTAKRRWPKVVVDVAGPACNYF